MTTKEKMTMLSEAVGKAEREFHHAVWEAIKARGGNVKVNGYADDDEDDEGKGLRVTILDDNGDSAVIRVDEVFIKGEELQVHVNEDNYRNRDYNMWLTSLGDAQDYVLEAIEWGDDTLPEEVTTNETFDTWDVCYEGGKIERGVTTSKALSPAKALELFERAVWVRGVN